MPGGRRPKLTPETQKAILDRVSSGVPFKYAATAAGVTYATLASWLAKGRKNHPRYTEFLDAFKKAEAAAIARNVAVIQKASQGGTIVERVTTTTTKKDGTTTVKTTEKLAPPQWTAGAWWLERRYPDHFASNTRELAEMRRTLAEFLKGGNRGHGAGDDEGGGADAQGTIVLPPKKPVGED